MSDVVAYNFVPVAGLGRPLPVGPALAYSTDAELIAACETARAAKLAFDEAARRGDPFDRLCELSEGEHRAVKAVSKTRSSTPAGIAEKALLLDCFVSAGKRSDLSQEAVDVALSLASDAVALVKAIIGGGAPRA